MSESREEWRHRWEPLSDPPEGWRSGISLFSEDAMVWSLLWTDAPRNANPHHHNVVWQKHRRVEQRRFVTEWEDAELPEPGDAKANEVP